MKLSYLLFVVSFVMLASNISAVEIPMIAKDDSSLGNRQDKKFQVTAGMGGEYSMVGYTLSGGYFINPSEVITFRYARITQNEEIETTTNELETLRSYTLGYKRFLGNSFNIQPTFYYRKSALDFIKEGTVKSIGTPNLIYDDIGIGLRIGNEWQWDNFVMGVDWIGINQTIYKINSKTKWEGSPQSLFFKKETTLVSTSFYLGLSF